MALAQHTISVTLPERLFRKLQYTAERTARPIEELVVAKVDIKQAEDEGLPEELANEVFAMQFLPDSELQQLALSKVTDTQYQRQAELNEIWNERDLSAAEQAELNELVAAYDKAVLIRTAAISQLQERGHQIDEYLNSSSRP